MTSRNVIVVVEPTFECWSNFKKLCDAKGLPYNYLKKFKFPIEYKEWRIYKLPLK